VNGAGLLAMRSRWRRSRAEAPLLRVGLLASYTVDPLVPYLGVGLLDAGLPAQVRVGPYNQIVQQCVDPDGMFARERPDVLVVAPRFEELSTVDAARDLSALADAAVAATRRWGSALLFVLPAVPEQRSGGIGDPGRVDGVVAGAASAREALRARLAAVPGVDVTDAEDAVRGVGAARAYRPALYRLAKVPFSEELFARLAAQVVRLVRVRYGRTWSGVVVDADSLLPAGADPGERDLAADTLAGPFEELRRCGVRLALRTGAEPATFWGPFATQFPRLVSCMDGAVDGGGTVRDQLRTIAEDLGVPPDRLVLLTADPGTAAEVGGVLLGPDPDAWPAELEQAGVLDRAPVPPLAGPVRAHTPGPAGAAPMSVRDYIAGLDVRVTYDEARADELPAVVEVVGRAKDFSLGIPYGATDPGTLTIVRVRDRYADHGIGGAVRLRVDGTTAGVDIFALSCPVLGKAVEEHVLQELIDRAAARGCDTLVLHHRDTGANGTATAFLETAARREWRAASGDPVALRVRS
jgi:predicted enzyme involved in methoxymalonyl-ACP biosynthesis